MSNGASLLAAIIGLALGYFIWGNQPAHIQNLKHNDAIADHGEPWIIARATPGRFEQFAVVDGFRDNAAVCNVLHRVVADQMDGFWACVEPSMVEQEVSSWVIW